jgi:glycerol-3-phosphate dehydrogenase
VKSYGTRLHTLIGSARNLAELGAEILPGVYEAELSYLVDQEWATSAEDILWRRSKLRLHLPANASAVLDDWLAHYRQRAVQPDRTAVHSAQPG